MMRLSIAPHPGPSPDEAGEHTRHETAVHILNTVLLPAMKKSRQVRRGRVDPALCAAVCRSDEESRGTLEITSKRWKVSPRHDCDRHRVWDVHDIGKNLVKTILANNGYSVIDLGKQVPAETIITKAVEVNATAIGLSALLVSTSNRCRSLLTNCSVAVEISGAGGGAAINRRFGAASFH